MPPKCRFTYAQINTSSGTRLMSTCAPVSRASGLGDGRRHGFDMAGGRVMENENLRHETRVPAPMMITSRGALHGKVGGAFTSAVTQHGGQETTLFSIITNLLHFGIPQTGAASFNAAPCCTTSTIAPMRRSPRERTPRAMLRNTRRSKPNITAPSTGETPAARPAIPGP
jgi:hypothetical protein